MWLCVVKNMKYMLSGAGVTRSPTVYKACNNAEQEEEEGFPPKYMLPLNTPFGGGICLGCLSFCPFSHSQKIPLIIPTLNRVIIHRIKGVGGGGGGHLKIRFSLLFVVVSLSMGMNMNMYNV